MGPHTIDCLGGLFGLLTDLLGLYSGAGGPFRVHPRGPFGYILGALLSLSEGLLGLSKEAVACRL